jgi:uncharacterized repeat protein (TIGR01451 family)
MKRRGLIFLFLGVCLLLASGPADGWVNGTGAVDISRSVVNRMEGFEYYNAMAGDGSLEIGHAAKDVSKSGNVLGTRTTRLSYSGDVPLVGQKRVERGSLFSGTKTSIEEAFSATEIEKEQTTSIGSDNSQLVGTDTKLSFNGTYMTSSNMHQLFSTDISSHQRFTGNLEINSQISFGGLADRKPSIALVVGPEVSFAEVGALVTRNYEVANTGTVPVQGLTLVDSRVGPVALSKTNLNPGEVASAVASFTILDEDLPGPLEDSVQVNGVDFQSNPAVASAAATVNLIGPWDLNLTVTATQPCATAGDVVTYIYTIENVGDFAISELNLTDSIGGGPIAINATLLPKESIALTANRAVNETDLLGPLTNSVSVSGFNSMGEMVGSSAVVVLQPC